MLYTRKTDELSYLYLIIGEGVSESLGSAMCLRSAYTPPMLSSVRRCRSTEVNGVVETTRKFDDECIVEIFTNACRISLGTPMRTEDNFKKKW